MPHNHGSRHTRVSTSVAPATIIRPSPFVLQNNEARRVNALKHVTIFVLVENIRSSISKEILGILEKRKYNYDTSQSLFNLTEGHQPLVLSVLGREPPSWVRDSFKDVEIYNQADLVSAINHMERDHLILIEVQLWEEGTLLPAPIDLIEECCRSSLEAANIFEKFREHILKYNYLPYLITIDRFDQITYEAGRRHARGERTPSPLAILPCNEDIKMRSRSPSAKRILPQIPDQPFGEEHLAAEEARLEEIGEEEELMEYEHEREDEDEDEDENEAEVDVDAFAFNHEPEEEEEEGNVDEVDGEHLDEEEENDDWLEREEDLEVFEITKVRFEREVAAREAAQRRRGQ